MVTLPIPAYTETSNMAAGAPTGNEAHRYTYLHLSAALRLLPTHTHTVSGGSVFAPPQSPSLSRSLLTLPGSLLFPVCLAQVFVTSRGSRQQDTP